MLKSGLLEQGVEMSIAGKATYVTALAQAIDLVAQGHRVILDSPCRYLELLDRGAAVASAAGVRYAFIELWSADPASLLPRLDERSSRLSQVASSADPAPGTTWEFGSGAQTLRAWQEQLVRPVEDWLRLDASADPLDNLTAARSYVDGSPRTGNDGAPAVVGE